MTRRRGARPTDTPARIVTGVGCAVEVERCPDRLETRSATVRTSESAISSQTRMKPSPTNATVSVARSADCRRRLAARNTRGCQPGGRRSTLGHVESQSDDHDGRAAALGTDESVLQPVEKQGTARQPGQRVHQREVAVDAAGRPAPGRVDQLEQIGGRVAGVVGDGAAVDHHGKLGAVRPPATALPPFGGIRSRCPDIGPSNGQGVGDGGRHLEKVGADAEQLLGVRASITQAAALTQVIRCSASSRAIPTAARCSAASRTTGATGGSV